MGLVRRWMWLAGAVTTILAAIFVALTLSGVQDATRAAGDLGELRAYAERMRSAAIAGDDERLATLGERRRDHMAALAPGITSLLGAASSSEAFTNLDRSFATLEQAAEDGDLRTLDEAVQAVTGQVNLLLGLLAAERDNAVELLRRLTLAGIALAVLGAGAGLFANLVSHQRVRQLTRSEAAANQRYEALIASMQNGILVLSDVGTVVYCNQAFAEMLGFRADALVGGTVDRFVPPELSAEFNAHRQQVAAGGAPVPPWLARCRHRDGGGVEVFVAVTPLLEDGRCVATLWEFRNVTREVQLSHQASLEAAKGEGVLGVAPVPIVVIDERGTVIAANAAVEGILGWPPDELVGQSVTELMPEPFASQHAAYLSHYLDTGEPSTAGGLVIGRERPAFAIHRDGRQFPVSIQVAESRSQDGRHIFTGVIYDLTRQSNLEGERLQLLESLMYEQRDVAIGTMVGGVAHDFNNLLTAIIGALDLEISTRGESSRWLDHAAVSARRASAVVQRLLRAVRPQDAELYPLDVRTVIGETVDLARETFDRRVSILSYQSSSLPLVLGDSTRIGQMLLNLLINARDAALERTSDAGPGFRPEIRVATAVTTVGDERVVRIMVSDNGVGMPPEVQERIFDPFFTTKRGGKGSGLGLAMVWSIIREMDGDIRVESTERIGTTITVDLPALVDGVSGAPAAAEDPTPRVLVVDDEDAIRDIVAAALHRCGCRVEVAASGNEALELLQLHGTYALVLLDLNMPGLTGWDVLSRMRQHDEALPVVIMSGTAQAAEAMRRGATGSLPKPFTLDDLVALVEQQLADARPAAPESRESTGGVGTGA